MKKNLSVLSGLLLAVLGFKLVLIPMNVNIGGFAGISQILNHFFGISYGLSSLVLNGALFIWGAINEGKNSVTRAICTTMIFSACLDYLPAVNLSYLTVGQEWFAVTLASIGVGAGFGLILRGDATTGGSDYLGKIITKRFPAISMGMSCTLINMAIVITTAFLFGIADFIQAIIATILVNESVNLTMYIKSDRPIPTSLHSCIRIWSSLKRRLRQLSEKRTATVEAITPSSYAVGQTWRISTNGSQITLKVIKIESDT